MFKKTIKTKTIKFDALTAKSSVLKENKRTVLSSSTKTRPIYWAKKGNPEKNLNGHATRADGTDIVCRP